MHSGLEVRWLETTCPGFDGAAPQPQKVSHCPQSHNTVFRARALIFGSEKKKNQKQKQWHPSPVLQHLKTFTPSVIFELERCVLSALDPELLLEFAVRGLLSGGRQQRLKGATEGAEGT